MNIACLKCFVLLSILVLFLPGCQQEQAPLPDKEGLVEANAAYIRHFGVLDRAKEGRAYANVGYLPLKAAPGQVDALPIFLFSPENRLEKVLQKLVSGDLVQTQKTIFHNPFPADLELIVHREEGGILPLDLRTGQVWNDVDRKGAVAALVETALQFDAVKGVKISFNGRTLPEMPYNGYRHDPGAIAETRPPMLLLMAGSWEPGEADPEELLVEFDRPVRLNRFDLFYEDGRKVEGDYYTSIFQMAVVVHPQRPAEFHEGMPLRADWSVIDFVGRENSGSDLLPLQRFDH